MDHVRRALRRELDRLTGEIMRRDSETDVCIELYARRERLRAVFCSKHCGGWRAVWEMVR
jgi:hypothetical protein